MKNIKKGDELSYDYGFSYDENYKQYPCKCKAKNCVGYIVEKDQGGDLKKIKRIKYLK